MTGRERRRKRIELAALGVVVVSVATALTWCLADAETSATATTPPPRVAPTTSPPRASVSSERRDEAVDAGHQWLDVESAAYEDLAHGRWLAAIDRIDDPSMERCLRFARPSKVRELEDAILDRATDEDHGGDGLWHVFVVAATLRDSADVDAQDRGRRAIAWASAKALVPYGRDRREFSRAYRAVRFGDGRLDAPGGAPVRRFQFEEAASRLAAARRDMSTWCYERRVLEKCDEYRRLARSWSAFVREFLERAESNEGAPLEGLVDAKPGRVVTFEDSQPDDEAIAVRVVDQDGSRRTQTVKWSDLTPARIADSLVLPRLAWLRTSTVAALARIFVETGEADAATKCLRCVAARADAPESDAGVVSELSALTELTKISGRVVPDDVRASPELEAWAERRRFTDVAHAIGGLGARDVGAFDDDAVDAYVAGGVLWAPEQWNLVRDRLLRARRADREGLHGFAIESDHFSIFTDVSAAFAAQASLVLDAAYEQASLALDLKPARKQSVVVFAKHEDYVARFHDRSGGCWRSSDRTIRTYLHDPARARFTDFYYPLLVHEAAHAVLGTGVSNWPGCWMHEGVASYFERWDPSRSVRANEAATGTTLLRRRRVHQSLKDGDFPDLASLLAMRREWDVDDFGPKTLLRYAAAESLFVHLMTDPRRRAIVSRFIEEANAGRDPADCLSKEQAAALQESWSAFVKQAAR
jgi:hypothetical protein